MRFDGITLVEGSKIDNMTVATGGTFPSLPNTGELFYLVSPNTESLPAGLYVYDGAAWTTASLSFTPVNRAGDTMTGQLTLAGNPTNALHAATKQYVDNTVAGNTITLTGDVTGSGAGSITTTLANTGVTAGTYNNVTVDAKGRVTAGSNVSYLTGNQTITLSGDATGSGATSITVTLANSGVTAGSYGTASAVPTITVDAKGRVTAASDTSIAIAASQVTSGSFADARISQSSVTQHQGALTIAETQITNGALLARVGDNENITGTWTFSNPVTVSDPTAAAHAATKSYVDNVASGLNVHLAVRAATTGNLTATYNNGASGVGATLTGTGALPAIDGVTLAVNDRVLVKNQTTAAENGIYVVTATSPNWVLTRTTDFDNSPAGEITAGDSTFVQEGGQATTQWVQLTTGTITVGTTAIVFTQFGGPGTYTAGNGLTLSGTTFSAVGTAGRIVVGSSIDLAAGIATPGTYNNVTVDTYGRVTAGSNVSYLTGNQTITLSGDVTGSGTTSISATLVNSGVAAGTYGTASAVPTITVDAKGRVTAASDTNIAIDASQVTSGTFADARLSSNVALKNAGNIFTQHQTIDSGTSSALHLNSTTNSEVWFYSSSQPANNRLWILLNNGTNLDISAYNDAGSSSNIALRCSRSGITPGPISTYDSLYVGYIQSGVVGRINAMIGDATHTGHLEFVNVSGSREGYIGSATTTGGNDAGTIPYVAGTHAFTGNITATGTISGNGSSLTSLNASNITTGTLADARLSSNVALKNAANTFTANQVINATGSGSGLTVNGVSSIYAVDFVSPPDGSNNAYPLRARGNATGSVYATVENISATGSANLWVAADNFNARLKLTCTPSLGSIGTEMGHPLSLQTNNTDRLTISAGGNVTINTPASGAALSVSPASPTDWTSLSSDRIRVGGTTGAVNESISVVGATRGELLLGGHLNSATTSHNGVKFLSTRRSTTDENTAAVAYIVNTLTDGSTTTGGGLIFGTRPTNGSIANRLEISADGNVTINTPSSGTALTVNGVATQYAASFNGGTAGSGDLAGINVTGSTPGYVVSAFRNTHASGYTSVEVIGGNGASSAFVAGHPTKAAFGSNTNTPAEFWTNNLPRIVVSEYGNVTINTPTSGSALTVFGSSFINGTVYVNGGSTTELRLISSTNSELWFHNTTQSTDNKIWILLNVGSDLQLRAYNDAGTSSNPSITFTRSGTTPGAIQTYGNLYVGANQNSIGYTGVHAGNGTDSGYTAFYSPSGTRVGYIGAATTFGTGDNGTLPYVAGTHAFTGNITATGKITTTDQEIAVGTGQAQDKWLRLLTQNRDVRLLLSQSTSNVTLYDPTGSLNRWTSDTSGNFTAAGNVTAYSDARLKTDVQPIEGALAKVSAMRGVSFTRTDTGQRGVGVIAQEVAEVVPEVVHEGADGYLSVAYGNLVGVLIEALKELLGEVEALRAEVKRLKGS